VKGFPRSAGTILATLVSTLISMDLRPFGQTELCVRLLVCRMIG
jgi:hypothetical protein